MAAEATSGSACLAVIPARGGSKRIPRKNIRQFLGRPMIVHTIQAALQSNLFSRVIVSTDDNEIAEICKEAGADVPFLRDDNLADDHTPVSTVTVDALERLAGAATHLKYVAQLLPCCPLRTAQDIQVSYEQFLQTESDSQVSIARYGWLNPWWAVKRDNKSHLMPLFPRQMSTRSQDLTTTFCVVGAVWWAKAQILRRKKTYHIATRTGWEIPWQRSLDIDSEEDLQLGELLMRMRTKE